MNGIAARFGPVCRTHTAEEQHEHRRPHRPAVFDVARHAAEQVDERRRDHEDRDQRPEVRPRRRVLERMRGVRIEESAPVRTDLLDDLLAGHRAHRKRLLGPFERGDVQIRLEVLDHTLLHEQQRQQQRRRQQHVQRAAREIDPEVAQPTTRLFTAPRDAAHQGNRNAETNRGRHEVVERQLCHLREVRHRRLAAVALPVRVGGERHRCLERLASRQRREFLRVERQQVLQAQHDVGQQQRREAEQQQRAEVAAPVLVFLVVDAGDRVNRSLEQPQKSETAVEHTHQVQAERFGDRQRDERKNQDLHPAIHRHRRGLRTAQGGGESRRDKRESLRRESGRSGNQRSQGPLIRCNVTGIATTKGDAVLHVREHRHEERYGAHDVGEVEHGILLCRERDLRLPDGVCRSSREGRTNVSHHHIKVV